MSSRSRSRLLALFLSLAPGWGQVYWGKQRLGLALFTLSTISVFVLLNAWLVYVGQGRLLVARAALVALVGAVGATWIDIVRRTSPTRVGEEETLRERRLREGMIAYLRGEHDVAKAAFAACVKADPVDVEALFRLGMTCARAGESREAASWLRRTRRHDLERKWSWEIQEELRRLKAALEANGAPASRGGAAGRRGRRRVTSGPIGEGPPPPASREGESIQQSAKG